MASAETIPIEALVAPISASTATGVNVRVDADPASLYYRIKDARTAARAAERQSLHIEGEEAAPIDWSPVLELAPKLLTEQSKDLEVAAWWIEALTREHGFAGLRDGFRMLREWTERYWDGLFPEPDEDGQLTRVAPLAGLNGDDAEGTLIAPISLIPITAAIDVGGPYSAWHYHQANELERIEDAEQRESRLAAGAPTMDQFRRAVHEAGAAFYADLREDVRQCREEYGAMHRALEERCGHFAPPSTRIADALDRVADLVEFLARDMVEAQPADAQGDVADAGAHAAAAQGAGVVGGPIRSREDALRTLKSVAEYYRRAEPHSPIAYLIEQAIRWGGLPLHQLIEELIPDSGSLATYHMMTGIRPPPSDD